MKIRIENGAQVREFFRKLDVNFDKAVNIAMNDTSDKMANAANKELSFSIGVNSDLFGSVVSDNNKPFKKYIGTNVEHAPYVEFGTGPQRVDKKGQRKPAKRYWPPEIGSGKYAKKASQLEAWRKKKGQQFRDNNQLRHAIWRYGTKPQGFMRKALQRNKKFFPEFLGKALAEMINAPFLKR